LIARKSEAECRHGTINRLTVGFFWTILISSSQSSELTTLTNHSVPTLGDLEIAVLEDIWRFGPSDTKAVYSRIGQSRSISLNTVQSTLERLFRKAMLQREKISHAYEYSARVSRRELIQKLVESTVRRVAGPQPDALLSAFVDLAARADDDQLKRLEELIARRRAELDQP
jgi:predicted transcriptional regulator